MLELILGWYPLLLETGALGLFLVHASCTSSIIGGSTESSRLNPLWREVGLAAYDQSRLRISL